MPQKKISTTVQNASAVMQLGDDDQLVEEVTTIKKVGRQKRPTEPATPEPDVLEGEIVLEDVADDFSDDADGDGNESGYPEGTLGYRLFYGDGGEAGDNRPTECNVLVWRKADGARDNFRKPAPTRYSESPIRNMELGTPESEIEEIVRTNYGGGHYYLQFQVGNRNRNGWNVTLADPPETAKQPEPVVQYQPPQPAPAIDPQAAFINSLKQAAELRGLLFGDVEAQLRDEIKRLREEREQLPPAAPKSEKLELLELAFNSSKAGVADRVVDALFPTEDDQPKRHWAAEMFSVAMEHKEEIAAIAGPILASFLGGPRPPMPPPMYQQPPPQAFEQPPPSLPTGPLFGRRKSEPEPESEPPASAGGNTDAPETDAEQTEAAA